MNTSHLKKFAQEARRKLLEQVGAKLNFVLTTDSAELREKTEQLKQLRMELGRTTKEQLIEKVAYTWFNRLMALRFMDVNDYQPLDIRILTPKDGYTIPELLDEAKRGNIPEELKVNRQKIYDLLDGKIPSTNAQNEIFKELLIAACNYLHNTFPFLFEKINDYTELLLPDDLTSDFSIVKDVRDGMLTEDCKHVEIIGWLYQFYISEKKDAVIGSKEKVKKEDIPAATQLFTPRWIVEYMVQNTVGKLWLQNNPKSLLKEYMPYLIESVSYPTDNYLSIDTPEEIKLIDPASGSGHILVYAFDLFVKIYEEEGYNTVDIPKLIIEKNLYGLEIDERAAQLSGLALMMKAREYQRRALGKGIQPNILCFQNLQLNNDEIKETLYSLSIKVSDELVYDLNLMPQATHYGSLITPRASKDEILKLTEELNRILLKIDVFQRSKIDALLDACQQLLILTEKYHCVVANPPYMGDGKMNDTILNWVKEEYPKSKADLFSCFIERSLRLLPIRGLCGLVTMESWMFLSSFEEFRKELIKSFKIISLSHFGWHVMRIAFGTVSFILENKKPENEFTGSYSYLEIEDIDRDTDRPFVFPKKDNGRFKISNQKNFTKISGNPIAYWLDDKIFNVFSELESLENILSVRQGLRTGNNERFLRYWHEVEFSLIGFDCQDEVQYFKQKRKYVPHQKGGVYCRWFGNNEFILRYNEDTLPILTKTGNKLPSRDFYFKNSITWTGITAGKLSFRINGQGFTFDGTGSCAFGSDADLYYCCGLLQSTVGKYFLDILSPTISLEVGHLKKFPVKIVGQDSIVSLVIKNISISKDYWDSKETSWNYKQNDIIRKKGQDLEDTYDFYKQYWENKFTQLHKNEEEVNSRFIEIYGLHNVLNKEVSYEELSLLKDEISVKNNKLCFHANEIFFQLIGHFIGCVFGRFSLDKDGFILINRNETIDDYLIKIGMTKKECTFIPDEDNIIPILDNDWFEDDIVSKFYKFLKVTFGEESFNKNLAFIEEQIGKDIRKYFIKDFYPDHIMRYKKRPIYWMFSSPKGAFNVLIYMHRYTPDTVSNILNKYLKELIGKLNTRKEHLQNVQVTGSSSDKAKAIKEFDGIEKMLIELHEYERDILYPLATERIEIDLDDGVLVNYNKFGKAVKEVNGLNDPATKKKVKEFDWIDTAQIR
jgi:hypothetical protein